MMITSWLSAILFFLFFPFNSAQDDTFIESLATFVEESPKIGITSSLNNNWESWLLSDFAADILVKQGPAQLQSQSIELQLQKPVFRGPSYISKADLTVGYKQRELLNLTAELKVFQKSDSAISYCQRLDLSYQKVVSPMRRDGRYARYSIGVAHAVEIFYAMTKSGVSFDRTISVEKFLEDFSHQAGCESFNHVIVRKSNEDDPYVISWKKGWGNK